MTNPRPTHAELAAWDDRVWYLESAWLDAACAVTDAQRSGSRKRETQARYVLDAVAAKLELVTARRERVRCELAGERWLRLVGGRP